MNPWYFVFPLAGALLGWIIHQAIAWFLFHPQKPILLLGIRVRGLMLSRKDQAAADLAPMVKSMLGSGDLLEKTFADPDHIRRLRPMLEEQIDQFMRVRLKESMPVVGMFIGDKTINQLKELFISELELIFPSVMARLSESFIEETDWEAMIRSRLAAIPSPKFCHAIKTALSRELTLFKMAGLLTGFLCGLAALGAVYFMGKN
jgi:uncharacterized membrane protein YheB (UPF0754 family)